MKADRWRTFTFQELIDGGLLEIGDGYRAKNDELGGDGPLFLRAGHVTDTHIDFGGVERFHAELADQVQPKLARHGDTIVTTKGNSTGRTSYVTPNMPFFVYSPHLSYWRSLDHKRLVPGFVRYWARGREFSEQLGGMKASTDMAPYLSLTDQRRLRITLPTSTEQQVIAEILGTLDDKIDLNRRMNETLERVARAIFRAWFVDFEPVKAKAGGARSFPGMPQEAFDALPNRLVKSELGPVPKGWHVGEVGDIGALSRVVVDPQDYPEEVFDHLSIPAFDDSMRPVAELGGAIKSSKLAVTTDCVLVSKLNPRIPRIWLPPAPSGRRQIASTEFLVTSPKPGWDRSYLYCLVQQQEFIEDMAKRASGTSNSHQRVKPNDYLGTKIVIPAQSVRKVFDDIAWPLLDLSRSAALENAKLAALRDYLLPKLLRGEVRVAADSVCSISETTAASRKRRRGHA